MPSLTSIVNRFTEDTIVYWEPDGEDAFGQNKYLPAREVIVRWEDKEQEILLPEGRKVISKAYLITSVVIAPGGLVWLGTLAQWSALSGHPNRPTALQGCFEVLKVSCTPGIRQFPGNLYEVSL